MTQEEKSQTTLNDLEKNSQINWEWNNELQKVEKRYQIISSIIFKYWILVLTIIAAITIFFVELQKRKTLSFDNEYEAEKTLFLWFFTKNQANIKEYEKDTNIKIIINQGPLDISSDIIHSYNNLIIYKGLTMPRGTFLYEPNEIKGIEYFNNRNYDLTELEKILNNTVFINYDEIKKNQEEIKQLSLKNKSIEDTFYVSCVNQHKIFNWVCNNYINMFLDWFFVYKINEDFSWFNKTMENIINKKKYKQFACNGLENFIKYTSSTPEEIRWLFDICWTEYSELFDTTQAFSEINNNLENKYIKPNISSYYEINEYKLLSYQQIIYNNLENNIPPYESAYKNYINYIINLLKEINNWLIRDFYYDEIYRFNNIYVIPMLNKIKYESTQSKREEIELIINEIEKLNRWDHIDWYIWLKSKITNYALEEKIKDIWWNITNDNNDQIDNLLKGLKTLSYLKVINDEIINNNIIKINWYISIKIEWSNTAIPFGATFEQKKWSLIVKSFVLNENEKQPKINEILDIIIKQKEYSIWDIYEFIQWNIQLYESNSYNITPCILLKDKLEKLNIEWLKILNCNESNINIIKWSTGSKTLYQFNMINFNINNIKITNTEIQNHINTNYSSINTNATTVSKIIEEIITYTPPKWNDWNLTGNNNTLIAISDLNKFLWIELANIWERSWRVAAEFSIGDLDLIWIYDTNTKILWPIFLKDVPSWTWTENPIISNFSLHLSQDNQNEINKFLIEPINYLYEIDPITIKKYLPERY